MKRTNSNVSTGGNTLRQQQQGVLPNSFEYSNIENHFSSSDINLGESKEDLSYRNVVPIEYDYLSGSASRVPQKEPIRIEVGPTTN